MKKLKTVSPNVIKWRLVLTFFLLFVGLLSCNKPVPINKNASEYSAEVIDKWITMQLRLMKNTTGVANNAFSRYFAYSGIVAFEALSPGTQNQFSKGKWNGLINLPIADKAKVYCWPASVNAGLAAINRSMFVNASTIDKASVDSLEKAIDMSFVESGTAMILSQSNAFGKAVADAVFGWSEADSYEKAMDPYAPPVGIGLWVPTPPAFAPATTPYWGNLRPIVAGSGENSQPAAPTAYSEDPTSGFYLMVKHVYDVSLTLTPDQMAMALFWRDLPGVSGAGHWMSIVQQVIKQTNTHLDKAAWAYAVTGTCLHDAGVSCWQTKYKYNVVRPVTYIRNVMGKADWSSFLTTPAHPEYSSAHAVISSAAADAVASLFGNIGSFTDHTYDYLGFAPRTFNSFRAIGEDAGNSRLYAGLHYQPSIDAGLMQGRKVTSNILMKLGLSAAQ